MYSIYGNGDLVAGKTIRAIPAWSVFLMFILCWPLLCGCGGNGATGTPGGGVMPSIELALLEDGFDAPVQVTSAGDGSNRLFVVEQPGVIRVIENGEVLTTPFLDISNLVAYGGERGLLSVAFPPDFDEGGHYYVNYTRAEDGATMVIRYSVDPQNPNQTLKVSEEEILIVGQPYSNHNGGMMAFGPDGYLYIALGDGGGGGDPDGNGQNRGTLLGSIIRIDVENGGMPYGIPEDNPYAGSQEFRQEIWAYGLRNPWRFSFDRLTGDIYIADVGQQLWEEIDFQPAASTGGENYGWNIMEGAHCFQVGTCDQTGLTLPVFEYDHNQGCSITGGYVYRGNILSGMYGTYFFADYCEGTIWGMKRVSGEWKSEILTITSMQIVSFGEDESGEIFVVDLAGGIYRVFEVQP